MGADLTRMSREQLAEEVKKLRHGRPVNNIEALANPEALEHFRNRAELTN